MKRTLILMLSTFAIANASPSGADIFKKCGICHGDKGQKNSLNITRFIAGMDKKELVSILNEYKEGKRDSYGLGTMMAGQVKKLSGDEIDAVSVYISKLPPVKTVETQEKKSIKADGVEIFKKCAICHGDKGQKHSLGVSKQIAGMDKKELIKILHEYTSGKRDVYGFGNMMKGQATKLTEDQLNLVSEYISSLESVDKKNPSSDKKKLTKEALNYNTFMREFFKENPDATTAQAKQKYKEYQTKIDKENNE